MLQETRGTLAQSASNVEVSTGGDEDLCSFYSTVASSTWKNHHQARYANHFDAPGDIMTGFVKNFPHVQSPRLEPEQQYESTYKSLNKLTEQSVQSADTARVITSESEHMGGFAHASSPSPIKWRDNLLRRQSPLPTQVLTTRRKRDPTEWENGGQGPADYSTSFKVSYLAPDEMEDKCNATASRRTSVHALEKKSLSSGWRENNLNRDHPWIHPGAPEEAETTYRSDVRYPGALSCNPEESPMISSGYSRSARKVVFGRNEAQQADKMSTTHLAYIKGRTSAMAGMVVEVRPGPDGKPLGSSGFCKNLSDPAAVFPQLEKLTGPDGKRLRQPPTDYLTSTGESFCHPGLRLVSKGPLTLSAAAGMPSSYARAVVPVNRLEASSAPALAQLHPTVALLRAKRDPFFYDSKTFKITQQPRPWMVPQRF
mmetsp:Transcript_26730/g.54466  ORF Transcript_26730/g.54466 Transcript_26730/m.54466 type:complete len:427 (-) Transcript_26730:1272-2552(-)